MSKFIFALIFASFIRNETEGSQIIDMSPDCSNNLKSNYFLTFGMGSPDGVHIVINNFHKNCTINLYSERSHPEIVQLLFLEIANPENHLEFCQNTNITIVSEGKAERVECGNRGVLVEEVVRSHKTSIRIVGDYFERIQLKATSAKSVGSGEECEEGENIICTINNTNFCIDAELQCEFYEYCGHFGSYSAITQTCNLNKNSKLGFFKNHWLIVTAGLIFSVILLLILLKLCCLTVPKISQRFFKSSEHLDNKLIVATQSLPIKKKVSTREIKVVDKKRTVSEEFEHEIQTSLYYQTGQRKKRLTTNSPVYRANRFSNSLLGSLSDDRTSHSSNLDEDETEDCLKRVRRKRRSNLI